MTCPRPGLNAETPPVVWQRNIQHTGFHLLSGRGVSQGQRGPDSSLTVLNDSQQLAWENQLGPPCVAVDCVAPGPACTPAAGGRSRIEPRPRGHMKESFKDSSLGTIEGRLPFLYVPSCFLLGFFPLGLVFGGISCQQCLFYRCVCVYLQFISSCECQVRRGVCVVLWDGDSWRVYLRFPGERKFMWKWITHVVIHYQ